MEAANYRKNIIAVRFAQMRLLAQLITHKLNTVVVIPSSMVEQTHPEWPLNAVFQYIHVSLSHSLPIRFPLRQ